MKPFVPPQAGCRLGFGIDRHLSDSFAIPKLPFSKQEEFLAAARRADENNLAQIMRRLAETDLAIKTSKATPRLQIEMLVAELTA